ncbi:MAG TPA: ketopantoate reductase family protein [Rhodocyclaceae bacterium]|nr:ketopantoate reductase family protein [Rhodocyclaceae bacterium]
MLGAGGIGGYFGTKLHLAGGDVTFLVRPARADKLANQGLNVISSLGNMHIAPKLVTSADAPESKGKFDVVMLSCKAYDLESAVDSVAPALAPEGIVVPLLNGLAHLEYLDRRFGRERVPGGFAHIGVTLTPEGDIHHLNELHRLVIGTRTQPASAHLAPLAALLARSGIEFSLSENIEGEMWDKFVFLTTLAAATCTMRAATGDILQSHAGEAFMLGLLDECDAVARSHGHGLNEARLAFYQGLLRQAGSNNTASMLRDMEKKGATEAEHILGDMVRRASAKGVVTPLLNIAYSHLQAYEIRKHREKGAG